MLVSNWRDVLREAWSIRLIILAGLLSGIEVILPFIGALPIPDGAFAALSLMTTFAAFVARILAQRSLPDA